MKNFNNANRYIKKKKAKVRDESVPKFHMTSPVGWMNDPNGLCYFDGKYHLFYQYNPYDMQPGTMLWGHFTSRDLITYRDEGVALVPIEKHVSIFSGGAIETPKGLCAVFTQHYEKFSVKHENTYVAYSRDGYSFGDRALAFDNETLPDNISRDDFRDPYPVYVNGQYYVLVGGKDLTTHSGIIVVLGGSEPGRLAYKFTIGPFYELGNMGECPSWHRVDGKDVIAVSGCDVKACGNDFKNVNSSVFIVGKLDFEGKKMDVDYISEIDKGDCFYAPQFFNGTQRAIMVAWHEMWGKPYPTRKMKSGWVGSFTIPRELSVREGRVFQSPVKELDGYCREYQGDNVPQCARLTFNFDGDGQVVIGGSDGSIEIGCRDGHIYLDTVLSNNLNGCIRRSNGVYQRCRVCLLLDVSAVELFIDGGRETISSRMYIKGDLSLSAEGGVTVVKTEKVEI